MAEQTEKDFNHDGTFVHLHNPETGGDWWCPTGVADTYVNRRGWEYAAPRDTSLDGLFDDDAAEIGFDPADHTVSGVNDYLAQMHAAGADAEVERVLALEAAGKDRTTIVDPRQGDDDNNG